MSHKNQFDLHFSAVENHFRVTAFVNGQEAGAAEIEFPVSPVTLAVDLENMKPGNSAENGALIENVGTELGAKLFTGEIEKVF